MSVSQGLKLPVNVHGVCLIVCYDILPGVELLEENSQKRRAIHGVGSKTECV